VIDADELAAFAAVPAPTGAESPRLEWLERRLVECPGDRHRDAAGNLIWSFAAGPPQLLVMAHVDTVFDADTELRFVRDGDWLSGPGIGDNATAVMAVLWTLERIDPPSGLVVAFTVGEEGLGNLRGARQACRDLAPARAIAVEGHGLDHVVVEHVGSVRARITVSGPGGHSWRDRGTPSAVHALAGLAVTLAGEGANVGRLSGGGAVNAIAAEAEMLVERRSIDDAELTAFEQRLNATSVDRPLRLTVEIVGRRGAGRIERDDPLVQHAMSVRRELGLAEAYGTGSTDANAAAALGIPAIGIGCANGSGMHTLHERIDLGSLELGCRQLAALIAAVAEPARTYI
jgi:tripeptide aminopeptidase